ncbi:MAG: hypothetical protein IKU26_08855 [Clostridia bacterium]|nr:hypothetical protein [Clostridia bacterium]
MKWTKRTNYEVGNLGAGYISGDFIIEETYNEYYLQKEYGEKKSDYFWVLKKGNKPIKYASTAKALKQFAETI